MNMNPNHIFWGIVCAFLVFFIFAVVKVAINLYKETLCPKCKSGSKCQSLKGFRTSADSGYDEYFSTHDVRTCKKCGYEWHEFFSADSGDLVNTIKP